jgi:hypothetical protein
MMSFPHSLTKQQGSVFASSPFEAGWFLALKHDSVGLSLTLWSQGVFILMLAHFPASVISLFTCFYLVVALMASSPDKQILALIHLPLQIQAGDLP